MTPINETAAPWPNCCASGQVSQPDSYLERVSNLNRILVFIANHESMLIDIVLGVVLDDEDDAISNVVH